MREFVGMSEEHKTSMAKVRAASLRQMAGMDFSERTRKYFEKEAIEWERIAASLAAVKAPN